MNAILILGAWLSGAALAAGPAVEVRTLSGEAVSGALIAMDAAQLTVEGSSGNRSVPLKEVLGVAFTGPSVVRTGLGAWIDLVDGSRLVGEQFTMQDGVAELAVSKDLALKIPAKAIRSVRLKDQDARLAAQWEETLATNRASDLVVVRQEDSLDFVEGVLGNVTAEVAQFTVDGDQLNVKRTKIHGLVLTHPVGAELPAALAEVSDADGQRLAAKQLALADNRLTVTTLAGVEVSLPLANVRELDFSLGKLRYLSDLEPESVERTPYFGAPGGLPGTEKFYLPRRDRSFDGGPLRLGKVSYAKGLSIKSRTRMVFRLPGKFNRLEAQVGIDASVAPLGNVVLVIRGDDKKLFEESIRGDQPPRALALDIAGVKRLSVEVDFGEGADVGDFLDLCEARVIQ